MSERHFVAVYISMFSVTVVCLRACFMIHAVASAHVKCKSSWGRQGAVKVPDMSIATVSR